MKTSVWMITSLLASTAPWSSIWAANFGGTSPIPTSSNSTVVKPAAVLPAGGTSTASSEAGNPQVTGLFRIVKPDGATVIQQTAVSVGGSAINVINVAASDAFVASNGKCAFNIKYDEVTPVAALNTTNRLFDNDVLIAQNTKIDLSANVLKTVWTQPYLLPGQNNVKLVINADSAKPSVGWVRVNVAGPCGGTTVQGAGSAGNTGSTTGTTGPTSTKTADGTAGAPPALKPPVAPPVVAVKTFAPGSAEWNTLFTAFGYSNFATTQLKGKTYPRYAELVKLNADLTAAVNAKLIDQPTFNGLISRWNSFVNDAAFKTAMAGISTTVAGLK